MIYEITQSNGGEKLMLPVKKDFDAKINELKSISRKNGESFLKMTSKELHIIVGGYPRKNHRMPICCDAMYDAMQTGDEIIHAPPKGKGASLSIKYFL